MWKRNNALYCGSFPKAIAELQQQSLEAVLSGQIIRYGDSLRDGRSEDRIPVEARFPAPIQTCSEAHPASYTMGTWSFPGVKWPGRLVDNPSPSNAEVKERVSLYLYYHSGLKKEYTYTSTTTLGLCGLFYGELYPLPLTFQTLCCIAMQIEGVIWNSNI